MYKKHYIIKENWQKQEPGTEHKLLEYTQDSMLMFDCEILIQASLAFSSTCVILDTNHVCTVYYLKPVLINTDHCFDGLGLIQGKQKCLKVEIQYYILIYQTMLSCFFYVFKYERDTDTEQESKREKERENERKTGKLNGKNIQWIMYIIVCYLSYLNLSEGLVDDVDVLATGQ